MSEPTAAQFQAALDERDAARAEMTQLRARLAAAEAVVAALHSAANEIRWLAGYTGYDDEKTELVHLISALDAYDTVRAALEEAGR